MIVQITEDFALRASRSQESCYMLFYVRNHGPDQENDKENENQGRAASEDANTPNRGGSAKKKSSLRAFL